MTNESIEEIVEELKKSPTYAMSLGSKELFHSNFWAYLMGNPSYKEFIHSFFPELDLNLVTKVERENEHRDIVIFAGNKQYVIENKIKSYPDKEQLSRYGENSNMVAGVITGINRPPFDLPTKWKFVSYEEIAKNLKEINSSDEYLSLVVKNYCKDLDDINKLLKYMFEETKGKLCYWSDNIKKLVDIRLLDVFRKSKADDFVLHCLDVVDQIKKDLILIPGWELQAFNRSFHNCKATIDIIIYKKDPSDKNKWSKTLGVQIEDNQFRLFMKIDGKSKEEIFNLGKQIGWFDKDYNSKTNRYLFGKPTSMKKNPCSYNSSWLYQYFDIWNDKYEKLYDFQDYKTLKGFIKEYIEKAIKIIAENNM